jgi:hypothetical protein
MRTVKHDLWSKENDGVKVQGRQVEQRMDRRTSLQRLAICKQGQT